MYKANGGITALLTARGGSTLPDKNIIPILGKPLLLYPADAAKRSRYISSFYATSDDRKILEIAAASGFKRISRPKSLARPNTQHVDVIRHAISVIEKDQGKVPRILVVLLANSAATKTKWIDDCIEDILNDGRISAVAPVCVNMDHHPFRAKRMNRDGYLVPFFDFRGKRISTNRQDLDTCYYLCHNFWALNLRNSVFSKSGYGPWTFMGRTVKPYIVESCCDVHSREDLAVSEKWVRENIMGAK